MMLMLMLMLMLNHMFTKSCLYFSLSHEIGIYWAFSEGKEINEMYGRNLAKSVFTISYNIVGQNKLDLAGLSDQQKGTKLPPNRCLDSKLVLETFVWKWK